MFKFDDDLNRSFRREFDIARNHARSTEWFEGYIQYRHDENGEIWAYPVHGHFEIMGSNINIYICNGVLGQGSKKFIKVPFNPNQSFVKTKAMVGYMFNYMNNLGF